MTGLSWLTCRSTCLLGRTNNVSSKAATNQAKELRCPDQHRRQRYWFQSDLKSPTFELPSGKKCFVFNAKRDSDGKLEPVLCFVDSQGKRLLWMDAEELHEFEKLIPRLEEYFKLHMESEDCLLMSHPSAG